MPTDSASAAAATSDGAPETGSAHVVEIFPWGPEFELGVEFIDRQHRVLVHLLNTLAGHLAFQADAPTIDEVLAELRHYTRVHFADEDALWRQALGDDPWVLQHEAEHDLFVARLEEFRHEEGQRSVDDVIDDIVRFLSRWLALHIIESDKRLLLMIEALRGGASTAEAREHAERAMDGAHKAVIDTVMGMVDKLARKAVLLSREISGRRRAEAQLRAANDELVALREAADRANAAKTDFLASVSHEIRTPLNAITGFAHLIRRGGLSDEQARRLDSLEAACDHLLAVVDVVLDLSRIEAGRLELLREPVSPAAVVAEVAAMLQARAEAKGVRLTTVVDALPHVLLGDATRLRQALLNYVANAVRFTSAGQVTVRMRQQSDDGTHTSLRFEVEDTGIGISPEDLPRLFNPFTQAHAPGARHDGGTGLGLVITRRLAEMMGGEAGAHSTPGQGSTFWFTVRLPHGPAAAAADVLSASRAEEIRRSFAGRRVLLVEDEPVNREIGQLLLEDAGLVVDTAGDGPQAIEKALQVQPALILMDMQLPLLDGLETTRRLRAEPAVARVPVIALTANAFNEDRQRCRDAGMDDFIGKPVRVELLYEVVLRWLQRGESGFRPS